MWAFWAFGERQLLYACRPVSIPSLSPNQTYFSRWQTMVVLISLLPEIQALNLQSANMNQVFSVRIPSEAAATVVCTDCILPIHQAMMRLFTIRAMLLKVMVGPLCCILYFCTVHWPPVATKHLTCCSCKLKYAVDVKYSPDFKGGGLVAQSCPTLATPWTVACQAPLSMGFPRQEYWSGLLFPSPWDLPYLGSNPVSCTAGRYFID